MLLKLLYSCHRKIDKDGTSIKSISLPSTYKVCLNPMLLTLTAFYIYTFVQFTF